MSAEEASREALEEARALYGFFRKAVLLGEGGVSHRVGEAAFWYHRGELDDFEASWARLPIAEMALAHGTPRTHAFLYSHLSSLAALVSLEGGLVLPHVAESQRPHEPLEETLYRGLGRASLAGAFLGGPFSVALDSDQVWLGLEPRGASRLASEWDATLAELRRPLDNVLDRPEARGLTVTPKPIFAGASIVGALLSTREPRTVSCFLREDARGRALGDQVLEQLDRRCETLLVPDEAFEDYCFGRGYRLARREGSLAFLEPPSLRTDLRKAASVCLLHPPTRTLLMGRRLTKPWPFYWSFPGGKVEPGETTLEAAIRELEEETALVVPVPDPVTERTVVVGNGEVGFAVTNFSMIVLDRKDPVTSPEMEARWVTLEEAEKLRPMAGGTRRVLQTVKRRLIELGWGSR